MKSFLKYGMTAALTALPLAAAADYPEKPVEFVIPFPPGDLEDILTRLIAEGVQEKFDIPAAVVNKPGGGGGPFPGAVDVALAPADGYTIGSFVIDVPMTGPKIGIKPLEDNKFEPIGIFLSYPFLVAASGDAPYSSMEELAEYAKANEVTAGFFSEKSTPARHTLAMAKAFDFEFSSAAAFDALDCNTLASGDADVINTTMALIRPCVDDLNILMSVTNERNPLLPDVPTAGELNPELAYSTWNGLFVHEDTPQNVRELIAEVAKEVVLSERAQQIAKDTGAEVYWLGPDEAAAQMAIDVETIARIDGFLNK